MMRIKGLGYCSRKEKGNIYMRPKLISQSAPLLASRYACWIQTSHSLDIYSLALVIKAEFASAFTWSFEISAATNAESVSPIDHASSRPVTTAHSSALKEVRKPALIAKPLTQEPRLSLIRPPAPATPGLPSRHPSTFNFIHSIGGHYSQPTSLTSLIRFIYVNYNPRSQLSSVSNQPSYGYALYMVFAAVVLPSPDYVVSRCSIKHTQLITMPMHNHSYQSHCQLGYILINHGIRPESKKLLFTFPSKALQTSWIRLLFWVLGWKLDI